MKQSSPVYLINDSCAFIDSLWQWRCLLQAPEIHSAGGTLKMTLKTAVETTRNHLLFQHSCNNKWFRNSYNSSNEWLGIVPFVALYTVCWNAMCCIRESWKWEYIQKHLQKRLGEGHETRDLAISCVVAQWPLIFHSCSFQIKVFCVTRSSVTKYPKNPFENPRSSEIHPISHLARGRSLLRRS